MTFWAWIMAFSWVYAVQPDFEPCIGKRALSSMLIWANWDEEKGSREEKELWESRCFVVSSHSLLWLLSFDVLDKTVLLRWA